METQPGNYLILVVIYPAGRAGKASADPLGYRCSGLGLMFSSIQAINTAELCPPGTDGDASMAIIMPIFNR